MMLIILSIILIVVFLILTIIMCAFDKFTDAYGATTVTIGIIALITFTFAMIENQNPTAMDVYRGKTTLEITYKGGVPVDSVVVFKERK